MVEPVEGLYERYTKYLNVRERCWDWWGSISSTTAASGAASGSNRVVRGGSYYDSDGVGQVANRSSFSAPAKRSYSYGFRVVRTAR